MSTHLPANYLRVISSLSELIERKLRELLHMLRTVENGRVARVERTFSDKERHEKILSLEKLLEANHQMFSDLNLEPATYREDQIFHADIAWLWTIINDSRTKRLKGYGKIDPETAQLIDDKISGLLDIIGEINSAAAGGEHDQESI